MYPACVIAHDDYQGLDTLITGLSAEIGSQNSLLVTRQDHTMVLGFDGPRQPVHRENFNLSGEAMRVHDDVGHGSIVCKGKHGLWPNFSDRRLLGIAFGEFVSDKWQPETGYPNLNLHYVPLLVFVDVIDHAIFTDSNVAGPIHPFILCSARCHLANHTVPMFDVNADQRKSLVWAIGLNVAVAAFIPRILCYWFLKRLDAAAVVLKVGLDDAVLDHVKGTALNELFLEDHTIFLGVGKRHEHHGAILSGDVVLQAQQREGLGNDIWRGRVDQHSGVVEAVLVIPVVYAYRLLAYLNLVHVTGTGLWLMKGMVDKADILHETTTAA